MCLNPIHLHKVDAVTRRDVEVVVPCGVCPECLKKSQSGVVVRTFEEVKKYPSGPFYFITLTYSQDKVPIVEGQKSLRREDIKNWKKDFKKLISTQNFSWLICGEYGPRTHRPHYHGLLIGLPDDDVKIAENIWKTRYGFTVFKKVPLLSGKDDVSFVARYISKYVFKDSEFKVFSNAVERPRLMCSIGYGLPRDLESFREHILALDVFDYNPFVSSSITPKVVDKVIERLRYEYRGFHYSIPLYVLRNVLYEKNFKGNLQASPLLKMVSRTLRDRAKSVSYEEFRQFCSGKSKREIIEKTADFYAGKDFLNQEKRCSQRKDILSAYKKSVI